jgi:UPF0716 family protein affecting phage T7 exclusion
MQVVTRTYLRLIKGGLLLPPASIGQLWLLPVLVVVVVMVVVMVVVAVAVVVGFVVLVAIVAVVVVVAPVLVLLLALTTAVAARHWHRHSSKPAETRGRTAAGTVAEPQLPKQLFLLINM